jgi:hypothetical protein
MQDRPNVRDSAYVVDQRQIAGGERHFDRVAIHVDAFNYRTDFLQRGDNFVKRVSVGVLTIDQNKSIAYHHSRSPPDGGRAIPVFAAVIYYSVDHPIDYTVDIRKRPSRVQLADLS